jgi:RND superfamily putative drug exporter
VRDAVTRAAAALGRVEHVKRVDHPYLPQSPLAAGLVARDGRGLLVVANLHKVDRPVRNATVDELSQMLRALDADLAGLGRPDARVRIGGGPVLNREVNKAVQDDLTRAEIISLPITLVVLIIVFGGLIAAGLPVLAAAVSVAAAMPLLYAFSKVTDIDTNTVTVVTLLGLGLSVDYGLLLVARYREELTAGFTPELAIARAWATAGRTILFSALTVAAALSGLLMFSVRQLRALGVAGVSIAVVAMLAALTFTAALIGLARKRIKPPRRAARANDERGFFAGLSRFVQRFPLLIAIGTAAILLAAGLPLLTATFKLPQLEGLPRSIESVAVADELSGRFGRSFAPEVLVVARADPAALDAWAGRWNADPAVAEVQPAERAGPGVASVGLTLRGESQDQAAQDLVARVRADRPPTAESWVTGDAAVLIDLIGLIVGDLPQAIGLTALAMVLLLFAMTGSLVVPVKAILANVVSLGATCGVLVAVFEYGWLSGILDTLTIGGLDPFVIVIAFAFAFALSMDYEIFLLGRIKEYVERGFDTDTAVRRGLQHTGRIITSAALLMLVVFGCFAAARVGQVEQVGLALSVAVLIDATVVRCLLVPATMTLLGRWNWWAPESLQRLHTRLGLREHPLPDAEPADSRDLMSAQKGH